MTIAALATPDYRIGQDTISRLASPGAPHASVVRAAFIVYGFALLLYARRLVHRRQWPPAIFVLLSVYGLGAIGAGVAQKNVPGTPPTLEGQMHVVAAALAGTSIIAVMVVVAASERNARRARATALQATVAVAAGIAFPLAWGTSVYGALEIVTLAVPAVWLASMTRTQRAEPSPIPSKDCDPPALQGERSRTAPTQFR